MLDNEKELPDVSIIVLTYNSVNYLGQCLESIQKLNYPTDKLEIIIADNNSSDTTIEFVERYFSWVKTVIHDRNYGYAGGNNRAIVAAKGEYVAFLNPDVYVDTNWLIELINAALKFQNNAVVALGGKVKFFETEALVQVAGSKMCIHGGGYNIGYGDYESDTFNELKYTLSPAGCAMIVKRDIFLKLGGFDSDYFMYVEEFDFGYRLWLAGYKSLYVPSAVVYHKMNEGMKFKLKPFIVYNEEKNRLATIIKDFQISNILKGIVVSFIYSVYRVVIYSQNRQFELTKAILLGQRDFLLGLKLNFKKRRIVQRNRLLTDKEMSRMGLLAGVNESYREFKRTKKYR